MPLEKTLLNILNILADGEFHSGEKIAKALNLSRQAVNQVIHKIELWGLTVFSVKGKGYRLSQPITLYSSSVFQAHQFLFLVEDYNKKVVSEFLNNRYHFESPNCSSPESHLPAIFLLPVTDSTNQFFMNKSVGFIPGDVCIAEYQYAGRGRRGRKYYAPIGCNLHFTFYWEFSSIELFFRSLSLIVGVLTIECLEMLGVKNLKLKWPNDIYLENKKLGGILIETKISQNKIKVIIGIGVNLDMNEVDPQIVTQEWISLIQLGYKIDKNLLVMQLTHKLRQFFQEVSAQKIRQFLERWQSYDVFTKGTEVNLLNGNETMCGQYQGIDEEGQLLLLPSLKNSPVRGDFLMKISIGDVSLRKNKTP